MSTETSVLGLVLPDLADRFKLDDWNGNMEKIDEYAANVNAELLSTGGSVSSLTTALAAETTAREAADATTASILAGVLNSGAKNILNWVATSSVMTIVDNNDGTFTVSGTPTAVQSIELMRVYNHAGEQFHLSGCPAGGNQVTKYSLLAADQSGTMIGADTGSGLTFTAPEGEEHFRIYARFRPNQTYTNLLFKPMLCAKAVWDIAPEFVPYAPSMSDMWQAIKALQ